jgi:hypothetical protein
MNKGKFISICKQMVKEYFNRYICDEKGLQKITHNQVEVIGFQEDCTCYRAILVTPTDDGLYYGVTYNKYTKDFDSYTYKKVGRKLYGRRNKNYKN